VWTLFSERFGLRPDVTKKELPFSDFVRLLAVAPGELLDGHFRLQSDNLLLPFATPDFVGHLEDMKTVEDFLQRKHVALRDHRRHATNSSAWLGHYYDTGSIDLIRKIYAEDFSLFGYSGDIADVNDFAPARKGSAQGRRDEDLVIRWIANGEALDGVAKPVKDFAAFKRTSETEEKLEIVKSALPAENDWSHLARYAWFVRRRTPQDDVRDAIHEKMASLRARYREAITDPGIFRRAPRQART